MLLSTAQMHLNQCQNSDSENKNPEVLQKLWMDCVLDKCFCDFTIKADSREFPVHKCMLGVMSDYFKKMFTSSMKEQYQNFTVMEGISDSTMEMVIEFIYNQHIPIKMENIYELIKTADYLQIPLLLKKCCDCMKEKMTEDNVFEIYAHAKLYNLDNIKDKCSAFFSKYFGSILRHQKYLHMEPDLFEEFITKRGDELVEEQDVFECLSTWLEKDKDSRQELFCKLFKLINLQKISSSYVNSVIATNTTVLNNTECSRILLEWMRKQLNAVELNNVSKSCQETDTSRSTIFCNKKDSNRTEILVVGGESSSNCIRRFDAAHGNFFSRSHYFDECWIDSEVLNVNNTLYIMGGRMSSFNFNSTSQLVCVTLSGLGQRNMSSELESKPAMSQCRHKFGSAKLGNHIYVAGGLAHKSMWLRSVESYNTHLGTWRTRPDMIYKRAGCGLVQLDGLLYAIGGCQGTATYHDTVESFDTHRWTEGPSMMLERSGLAAVVLDYEIYAIGGEDEDDYLDSVEKLSDGDWISVESLLVRRSDHKACVINGKIYVIGGKNERGDVNEIEVYDPYNNTWKICGHLSEDLTGINIIAL